MKDGPERRARLERAHLYLVTEPLPEERLRAALAGGVDIVQLRDKGASDQQILEAAPSFRAACAAHGALFVLNDRPDLAVECGADGVHVGQEDAPVEDVRGQIGPDLLIGLSTHAPEQLAAGLSGSADYLCAGPVWETPTKAGRPAAGLGYVGHAAAHAGGRAWFAIGGIDEGNVAEVTAAGASRIVVVRSVRDAPDPGAAARALRAAVSEEASVGSAQ